MRRQCFFELPGQFLGLDDALAHRLGDGGQRLIGFLSGFTHHGHRADDRLENLAGFLPFEIGSLRCRRQADVGLRDVADRHAEPIGRFVEVLDFLGRFLGRSKERRQSIS